MYAKCVIKFTVTSNFASRTMVVFKQGLFDREGVSMER